MSALSAANSPTDKAVLVGILGSHPRLGRPKVAQSEHISELSKKEQAQLNTGAEELAERLRLLNAEYEEKFPGLRFVFVTKSNSVNDQDLLESFWPDSRTFVNGRSRDVIMVEMRQRIDRGDAEKEIEETIQVRGIVLA